jgi:hypothetical protein
VIVAQERDPLARIPVARKIPEDGRFAALALLLRKTGIRWREFRSRENP